MKHIDRIIKYTHLSELDIEKIKYNRTMILCANLVEYITSEIIPLLGMDYNTKTITDDLCRVYGQKNFKVHNFVTLYAIFESILSFSRY